jgi:hypothetical protein
MLLLFPFSLLAQSFDTQLGNKLSGSELKDRFQVPQSRVKLQYGSTMGKFSFFDTKNKIAYQGFGTKKGFEIGEFNNYVDFFFYQNALLRNACERESEDIYSWFP